MPPELMACKFPAPQRGSLHFNCFAALHGCCGVHRVAEEGGSLSNPLEVSASATCTVLQMQFQPLMKFAVLGFFMLEQTQEITGATNFGFDLQSLWAPRVSI